MLLASSADAIAWQAALRGSLKEEKAMVTKTEVQPQLVGFSSKRVGDVTVLEVRGTAKVGDVVAIFREFLAHPTPLVLWDMRGYTLSHLADDDLRTLVSQLMRMDREKRLYGRSAFVCPRDADYFVMRMLILYMEANDYGLHLAVFRDIDDARCWLAEV
jgi:hypothetical protein